MDCSLNKEKNKKKTTPIKLYFNNCGREGGIYNIFSVISFNFKLLNRYCCVFHFFFFFTIALLFYFCFLIFNIYKYMYVCMCICVYMYVCMCMCVYVCIYIYIYIYIYIHMYVYMYISVCVCVCVCVFIFLFYFRSDETTFGKNLSIQVVALSENVGELSSLVFLFSGSL